LNFQVFLFVSYVTKTAFIL